MALTLPRRAACISTTDATAARPLRSNHATHQRQKTSGIVPNLAWEKSRWPYALAQLLCSATIQYIDRDNWPRRCKVSRIIEFVLHRQTTQGLQIGAGYQQKNAFPNFYSPL